MKKFLYSLKTDLRFEEPVNNHTFLLRASPLAVPSQEPMRVSLSCSPACGLGIYKDAFGNLVHQGYLERGHDSFTFCSTGEVLIDVSKKDYSEPAPYYLFHTPLTRLEGVLAEYFLEFRTTGSADKVTDYWVSRISCDFRYQKGVTSTSTTASEAWKLVRESVKTIHIFCLVFCVLRAFHAGMSQVCCKERAQPTLGLSILTVSIGWVWILRTTQFATNVI